MLYLAPVSPGLGSMLLHLAPNIDIQSQYAFRWLCIAASHGANHGVCTEDQVITTHLSHTVKAAKVLH